MKVFKSINYHIGALALVAVIAPLSGCSSSTSSPQGVAGDGGAPSGDGGALSCETYCSTIMQNCAGGDGSQDGGASDPTKTVQQYNGADNCLAVCKTFPVGTVADTSGNTLGCRSYHAKAAASDPMLHCPHAGPGGDKVCGADPCEAYCGIVAMYCTAASQIYTDTADCMASCHSAADDVRFNIGVQEGDHLSCLLYHAQESPLAPDDHCLGDLAKNPVDSGVTVGSVTCH